MQLPFTCFRRLFTFFGYTGMVDWCGVCAFVCVRLVRCHLRTKVGAQLHITIFWIFSWIRFYFFTNYFHKSHSIFCSIIFIEYTRLGSAGLLVFLFSVVFFGLESNFWKSPHFCPNCTCCVSYSFSFSHFRIFAYILDTQHHTFSLRECSTWARNIFHTSRI